MDAAKKNWAPKLIQRWQYFVHFIMQRKSDCIFQDKKRAMAECMKTCILLTLIPTNTKNDNLANPCVLDLYT